MADIAAEVSASLDSLTREFDIIAHNMANVSTAGFKRRCNSFTQALAAQERPIDRVQILDHPAALPGESDVLA